jgi:hypothetical protein
VRVVLVGSKCCREHAVGEFPIPNLYMYRPAVGTGSPFVPTKT